MIIVNADDWGRSVAETDAAQECFRQRRITSATAMVFMADSERAAEIALREQYPIGLHINFSERFTGSKVDDTVRRMQARIVRYLNRHRYMQLCYNPFLAGAFRRTFEAQLDEFRRLYTKEPSHFDGHQHMHLCANMLITPPIPKGKKVRRTFSFEAGEKSIVNRSYRAFVERRIARRYQTTDYFFALAQNLRSERLKRVAELARQRTVELMTHPIVKDEYALLMSEAYNEALSGIPRASYSQL
jgi:predicted glycoside hydrolase/deacetylase ChbG (UPF0249 family)